MKDILSIRKDTFNEQGGKTIQHLAISYTNPGVKTEIARTNFSALFCGWNKQLLKGCAAEHDLEDPTCSIWSDRGTFEMPSEGSPQEAIRKESAVLRSGVAVLNCEHLGFDMHVT